MESRLNDACNVHLNILTESDKMLQYIQFLKEKSEEVITQMKQLSPSTFLKNYSRAYKHLHALNQILIEHNCNFELLFLELDEATTQIPSTCSSLRDVSINSENIQFDTYKSNLTKHFINNTTNEINNYETLVRDLSDCSLNNVEGNYQAENENDYNAKLPGSTIKVLENPCLISDTLKQLNNEPFKRTITSSNSSASVILDCIIETSARNNTRVDLEQQAITENVNKDTDTSEPVIDIKNETDDSSKALKENKDETGETTEPKVVLNIKKIIEHLQERDREKQEEAKKDYPDLRPVVIVKNKSSNDSASESELSLSNSDVSEKLSFHSIKNNNSNFLMKYNDETSPSKEVKPVDYQKPTEHLIIVKKGPVPEEGDLCYVSHIISPACFYIQIISDDSTLIYYLSNQILEILQQLKSFKTKPDARNYLKLYCVCYIEESETWYRAMITDWLMENEELIEVQLIDYGNTCLVPLKNIREAIPYFFSLPCMTSKCELAWVKPLNNSNEWSTEINEYFCEIIRGSENRLFTISYVMVDGDRLIIDLQNNEIYSIAGELIAQKKAVDGYTASGCGDAWCNDFMKNQVIKSQGFNEQELRMNDEQKLEQELKFDDDEEYNDPTLAVAHYKPKDETQICRIFQLRGHCFKGKKCTRSHEPLNPDGWTNDREAVYYETFNQTLLPSTDEEITLQVVSIVDLKTFYVVTKNMPSSLDSLTQPITCIKDLVKLMNDSEKTTSYRKLKTKPAIGELILLQYNNKWQRGKVLEVFEYHSRVELDIFLVDFGIVVQHINMKDVRCIQKEHLYLPFQVVMCSLANVLLKETITEEETEMGSDYLELNVLHKKLKAKVVYSSVYLNVILYNEKGEDIGKELIKSGIVNETTDFIRLKPNSLLLVD